MKLLKFILPALAALAFVPAPAGAQIAPSSQIVLTTSTGTIASGTTTQTCTSQAFSPNSSTGFAVLPNVSLTTGGTSNATFYFAPSLDGSNYATVTPLSYVLALSGTPASIGFCNFPPNVTGSSSINIPYWRLSGISNSGTSTLTINSITISKTNR
jgi:hypothetical protein